MDSVSQIALGAAVTVAVVGRRSALWKSAAFGAALGTLPDLDVVIDYGDAVLNMVMHRADSHSLLWLTLIGPPLGALLAVLAGDRAHWRRWALAAWLALFTHPLLDLMTIYGTQLLRPFTSYPYGIGSVFVIDPLYTLPLLLGLGVTVATGRLRANQVGLALATLYLAWGVVAQQHVIALAQKSLQLQGIVAERLLVTPTAFNTVLWRIVAVTPEHHHEAFYSLFDAAPAVGRPAMEFERFERFGPGAALIERWQPHWAVRRIADFSHGFYKIAESDGRVWLTDLRMGQEPFYSFNFDLGAVTDDPAEVAKAPPPVTRRGLRAPLDRGLPWLWQRMRGEPVPPPR